MAKLQAINAVLLILLLLISKCTSLSVNASNDEFNNGTDSINVATSNAASNSIDAFLLLIDRQSPNSTDDGNGDDDVYDATVVEITNEPQTTNIGTDNTTFAPGDWVNTTENNANDSISEPVSEPIQTRRLPIKCKDGLILRAWPIENITNGDRFARGMVYFLAMCYLFLGVSIVSDRFMAAIEKITANEKEVIVRRPDGMKQVVIVRVWNQTVANLTLMVSLSRSSVFSLCNLRLIHGSKL